MKQVYPIEDNDIITIDRRDNMGRKYYTVAIEWKTGNFRMERVYVDSGKEVQNNE